MNDSPEHRQNPAIGPGPDEWDIQRPQDSRQGPPAPPAEIVKLAESPVIEDIELVD